MGSPAKVRTPGQNRRIWGLVAALRKASGLDEEELTASVVRPLVMRISGQESTARLTPWQAEQLISRLEAEANKYGTQQRLALPRPAPTLEAEPEAALHVPPDARGVERISPGLQAHIMALFAQIGWDTVAQQRAFVLRQLSARRKATGVVSLPWPQTQAEADAVIEGLKAQILRPEEAASLAARARALVGHPRLDAFEVGFIADLVHQYDVAEAEGSADKVMSTHKLKKLREAERRCGVAR